MVCRLFVLGTIIEKFSTYRGGVIKNSGPTLFRQNEKSCFLSPDRSKIEKACIQRPKQAILKAVSSIEVMEDTMCLTNLVILTILFYH